MQDATIPVNDLGRYSAQVASRLSALAAGVIASGHYVLGPNVTAFEGAFAQYCGTDHCVGVANGTDALEIALRAVGVEPGDAVVVAANGAMYGTTAVLAIGAVPVFADVCEQTALVDASTLEAAVQCHGSAPKAAIVTHLYGRLAAMTPIMEWARARGIALLEDCAQAHGARDANGARAGSFGDAGCFSFYPTKNLGALGDGGAITCNDPAIAVRLRQFRQYGWSRKYHNVLAGGRNSRLDEIQAAFLRELLGDLDRRNASRVDVARRYTSGIRNPAIRLAPMLPDGEDVAHLFIVQCSDRDALASHLAASGISTDVHYPVPDYQQPAIVAAHSGVSLPVTEAACRESLTLPCFPELRDDEVEAVISACNAWNA